MTQNEALLKYLKKHKGITQWDAAEKLGILRLSERVRELESDGYLIARSSCNKTNRYGHNSRFVRYSLARTLSLLWSGKETNA